MVDGKNGPENTDGQSVSADQQVSSQPSEGATQDPGLMERISALFRREGPIPPKTGFQGDHITRPQSFVKDLAEGTGFNFKDAVDKENSPALKGLVDKALNPTPGEEMRRPGGEFDLKLVEAAGVDPSVYMVKSKFDVGPQDLIDQDKLARAADDILKKEREIRELGQPRTKDDPQIA